MNTMCRACGHSAHLPIACVVIDLGYECGCVAMRVERFDGQTFSLDRDGERLTSELQRVKGYVMDGEYHTLAEISAALGYPEASVSARLRDLRKPRFGGYLVEREYVTRGLWRYRLAVPEPKQLALV